MVVVAADETECKLAAAADHPLRTVIGTAHNYLAVRPGTEAQLRMGFHEVPESKLLVLFAQHWPGHQAEHHILGCAHVTFAGHATDGRGDPLSYLALKVHCPAVATERVTAAEVGKPIGVIGGVAHGTSVVPVRDFTPRRGGITARRGCTGRGLDTSRH